MEDSEYINLSDLKVNKIDEQHEVCDAKIEEMYQIQPDKDGSTAVIMEVGRTNKISDILINKFDLSTTQRCIITSKVYTLGELVSLESTCAFPLIKIIINYNDGIKLNPIANLALFFHTFNHHKDRQSIKEYLSTKNNRIVINGLFSISFHFNDKKIVLENIRTNPGIKELIDKMIHYIASSEIRKIIDELTLSL